jgi:hypothetical protein
MTPPPHSPDAGDLPTAIPRAPLWTCLLLPGGVALAASLLMPVAGLEGYFYRLWFLPLIAGPITGFICTPWFVRLLKQRYRGRSLVLISSGYAFGQMILSCAIGFGGCLLVANTIG